MNNKKILIVGQGQVGKGLSSALLRAEALEQNGIIVIENLDDLSKLNRDSNQNQEIPHVAYRQLMKAQISKSIQDAQLIQGTYTYGFEGNSLQSRVKKKQKNSSTPNRIKPKYLGHKNIFKK